MKALGLLLLALGIQAKNLHLNNLHDDFDAVCDHGQSVSGISVLTAKTEKGTDVRFMLFCRELHPNGTFRTGNCRNAEEFDFVSKGGKVLADNRFSNASNCEKGEYLSGILAKFYKENSVRKLQYQCCEVKNAEVHAKIGCHHVGPVHVFSEKMYAIRNSNSDTKPCVRDLMSAMEITEEGITLEYCPYKEKGVDYDEDCNEIKEVETFTETPEANTAMENTTTKTAEAVTAAVNDTEISQEVAEKADNETTQTLDGKTTQPSSLQTTKETTSSTRTVTTTESIEETAQTAEITMETTQATTEVVSAKESDCVCICSEVCEESATIETNEINDKNEQKIVLETKTTKDKESSNTNSIKARSHLTMNVEEEERDGKIVFILVPSESIERCPENQCNCPASCTTAKTSCTADGKR